MLRKTLLELVLGCLVMLVACKEKTEASGSRASRPEPSPGSSAAASDKVTPASKLFMTRCSACHGEQGRGDGPAAAVMNPAPRNFAEPAWQAEVTDEHLRKIITQGGVAVGRSAAMPPALDLAQDRPLLDQLVTHIRGLKR